jgi:hypothetical protein
VSNFETKTLLDGIEVDRFAIGVYFLELKNDEGHKVIKFIKD